MSESADKNPNAFTPEEATQIIIAGIQARVIRFPFTVSFDKTTAETILEKNLHRAAVHENSEEFLRNLDGQTVAGIFATLARRDALFLLTLRKTLIEGLTQEEADRIVSQAAC